MDAQFWLNAWDEGKIGFHQPEYNKKLVKYFPQLEPEKGQRVLVPLCGKSKDLLWLHGINLYVHGVELCHDAAKAFFEENELPEPRVSEDSDFKHFTHENIILSCGNFFKLNENDTYDFVYDRASLVALPPEMREDYARVIKQSLKTGGKYLLIVFEYDQELAAGPPFSITPNEIHRLYENEFIITLVESKEEEKASPKFKDLSVFKQKVYILQKK